MAWFSSVSKVANGFSYMAIGSSTYALVEASRAGDAFGAIEAGSGLGWSIFGLTGPAGAVGATAYGATSLAIKVPAVERWTVKPLTDFMCYASENC